MSWQDALLVGSLLFAAFCIVSAVLSQRRRNRLIPRNRRVNLPPPKPDERDSITNFRRMHRP